MKHLLKAMVCVAVLSVCASAMAACSPNTDDTETVTTTTAVTTTVLTTTTNHGILAAGDVIVRSGPGLDYDAIGGITYNEDVIILGREGDWYRIQFGDQVGYISAQYVDTDDAPNASEMVEGLKTTATINTTKATTTKANTTTTVKGATTTTAKGDTPAQTTTAAVSTTTTSAEEMPLVGNGIPEEVVIDDFDW